MPRPTVYQDREGQWRWRIWAANNEIVATGEAYSSKSDAMRGLQDAKEAMADTEVGPESDDA